MDSITQAALGAAIGQAVLGKKIGPKAAIIGAAVATIPDLDVLLLPFFDTLEGISVHRGYSHSIFFSVLGAALLTFIFSKLKWTSQISIQQLFVFNWLALFTHMLLDAFTTYGTQLFLPFSDQRVSFDSVNIVDPFYTVPLIIGVFLTIYQQLKKSKWSKANSIGIIISSLYLIFTLANKNLISNEVKSELGKQQIQFNDLTTVPVGIGNFNWYGVARNKDSLFIGAYRSREKPIHFESFPINEHLLQGIDPELSEKLKWMSKNFYTVAEDNGIIRVYNLQCDMQGVRTYGNYKAPTAFYYEITPQSDGSFKLSTGMHPKTIENEEQQ